MAVVAFRLNFHSDGKSEHMKCQSNRHKLHLLSESVDQPLYAFVYPSRVLPDTAHPYCERFILHRAILVTSVVRYARKVILVFIVSTISR